MELRFIGVITFLSLTNGDTYVAAYHLIANDAYQYALTYWSAGAGSGGVTSGPITAPGTGTALGYQHYNQPGGEASHSPPPALVLGMGLTLKSQAHP